MRYKFIFCFFIVVIFSCKQNASKAYEYASLQVDTSKIKIFNWDSSLYAFPKYSEPLPLTNDDIKLVDSLLIDAVEKFNQANSKGLYEKFNKQISIENFIIDLSKYKRQYFPYNDSNGQRVFQLICFSETFSKWRNEIYYGKAHGGISRFTLRINLSERKADEFSTSGYG